MKHFFCIFIFTFFIFQVQAQDFMTVFEKSNATQTATYQEGIEYLQKLADEFPTIQINEEGLTDVGLPLHTVVFSSSGIFSPEEIKAQSLGVILINNAIHPGEPDGVDASLMLLRDFAQSPEKQKFTENIVLVFIPFYNVGGALNRSSFSRVNQNGPESYGFRGNAQNLDLNRDFIKCDSKNALAFTEIFQKWNPDIYIENHVSNGADYQYVITLLETQANKLGADLGVYLKDVLLPDVYSKMENKNFLLSPYVNVHGQAPDKEGIPQFLDLPRYSSGYATLFHTFGFIVETHMLKPYKERVEATYTFMEVMIEFLKENQTEIQNLRKKTEERISQQSTFPIHWELDKSTSEEILFKGYEAEIIESEVTGLERLYYNREKPYEKNIPYFSKYKVSTAIEKPIAYIIPQAYSKVIERLRLNNLEVKQFNQDTELELEMYYIKDYSTIDTPFEGHYLHYNTKVRTENQRVNLRKGDFIVFTNQVGNRYLIETLEPEAPDSFFNWNFFDAILRRKEGFSAYVFEDKALEILNENPDLKSEFENKKQNNFEFAQDANAQLNFIYKNSPYYEKEHLRYPIFRLNIKIPTGWVD